MNKLYTLLLLLCTSVFFAQDGAPAAPYYNGFDFTLTGADLKSALATKITTTHTSPLSYTPGIWEALKVVDQDPENPNNLLLLYGYTPANRSMDKDLQCGGSGTCVGEWNREHAYAKALGTPNLGTSGPGADAHHIRASDYTLNEGRGSKKYTAGSGNAGSVGAAWYPGDEWKGDVARMIMYMYLRYGNQCLPKNAVIGTIVPSDPNMPALLLQWNAEDPVSAFEDNRNTYLGNSANPYGQGNRNPFIDNPYLATVIWGGPVAEDRWAMLATPDVFESHLTVYPNPAVNNEISIHSETVLDEIQLININGQVIQYIKKPEAESATYTLHDLPQGFYLLKLSADNHTTTRKVVVN